MYGIGDSVRLEASLLRVRDGKVLIQPATATGDSSGDRDFKRQFVPRPRMMAPAGQVTTAGKPGGHAWRVRRR